VALIVLLIGIEIALAAGFGLQQGPRSTAGEVLDSRSDLIAEAVTAEARRYTDAVRAVAASAGAVDPLDADRFASVTLPLRTMHLAGATAVAFVVPATDRAVPHVQAEWRTRGAPGLKLVPQGSGREHLFPVLVTGIDSRSTPSRTGIDLSQSQAPARALADARSSDDVGVSDTYQLLRDRGLPPAERQNSFCLAAPVYGSADSADAGKFRGWILLGMHGEDFGIPILKRAGQGMVDVTLSAENSGDGQVQVASVRSGSSGARDLRRERIIPVVQRRWRVNIEAAASALPGGSSDLPAIVTAGGITMTVLLCVLVLTVSTGRSRAQALHAQATAELDAMAEELGEVRAELRTARGEPAAPPERDPVSR
jgi:hypothetical protein